MGEQPGFLGSFFKSSSLLDRTFLRLMSVYPEIELGLGRIVREAAKWEDLPKGWTEKSVESFWDSLTGEAKHKVTKCIKEMGDKVTDAGAFCAALADKVDPGWRGRTADVNWEALIAKADDVHSLRQLSRKIHNYVNYPRLKPWACN